jgi:fido (protein-threonine AMPylation protein)
MHYSPFTFMTILRSRFEPSFLRFALLTALTFSLVMQAAHSAKASPPSPSACPPWLAQMPSPSLSKTRFKDLCQLATEFNSARARVNEHFAAEHLDLPDPALRLRGIYGPRLVDYISDFVARAGTRAHSDPWWIYSTKNGQDPTPEVFQKWQTAAHWVDSQADENFSNARSGANRGIPAFTAEFITTIHKMAFHGLVDWGVELPPDEYDGFRQEPEQFGSYFRANGIVAHNFDHLRYPVDAEGRPTPDSRNVGEFHPVHCMDESAHELTEREESLVFPNGRRDSSGQAIAPLITLQVLSAMDHDESIGFDLIRDGVVSRRQCGYFSFVDVPEIASRVDEALKNLSQLTSQWYQPGASLSGPAPDPLRVVARLEHWLIGIHPFNDGNGRTIRLMGDYLLKSLGLPAPIYWTTWDDMNYSEAGWAEQVADGLARAESIMEGCANYLEGKPSGQAMPAPWDEFCVPVPLTPTARPW